MEGVPEDALPSAPAVGRRGHDRGNAYASFIDDRERRLALWARDVRLVLVAAVVAMGAGGDAGGGTLLQALGHALQ